MLVDHIYDPIRLLSHRACLAAAEKIKFCVPAENQTWVSVLRPLAKSLYRPSFPKLLATSTSVCATNVMAVLQLSSLWILFSCSCNDHIFFGASADRVDETSHAMFSYFKKNLSIGTFISHKVPHSHCFNIGRSKKYSFTALASQGVSGKALWCAWGYKPPWFY